jgi:L-arabinokinase
VQRDGLELDIDATRESWRDFASQFDARVDGEAQLLHEVGAHVVVGDIPPLAFAAASRAHIPSLGMTNFTWDWIYSAWPDFEDIVARIRAAYALADGLLRLPLHGDCGAFQRVEDVPLVARRAMRSRQEVRAELGIRNDATVVLFSFGGFTAEGLDFACLADLREYIFVTAPPMRVNDAPPNVLALNESPADYVSLLAACDVVITKPGYGIVADCLANRVAALFTDRGPFREYDVLAAGLQRWGRARYVPRGDLSRLDLREHLRAIMQSTTEWTTQPVNGAEVVAERVVARDTI